MGYMRHHAMVVTSWDEKCLVAARTAAVEIGLTCSPLIASPVNGYQSFMVCPDGSKEGWTASDAGDSARAAFVLYLEGAKYEDGSSALDWVEVFYGDDDGDVGIVHDSSGHNPHSREKARLT